MKFPRKLSKERLSLLSPEDRKIYEYEHSGLCPEMKKLQESKKKKVVYNDKGEVVPDICPKCGGKVVVRIQGEPIYVCSNCDEYYGTMPFNLDESEEVNDNVEDDEITYEDIQDMKLSNEYSEEEKRQIKQMMDEMLFESQFDELFDKELIAEVGLDEYNNIKKNIFEYVMNDPDLHTLNEAEGHSADWWMDCSWILKLSAGLLTGLLGIIAWLFMKGKDRLAMMKLKQYMNKLVELTDSGVNKKRPWYSFLLPGRKNKQNTGDYNKACFRTIQETAERNMAGLYAETLHTLGFLSPGISNFNSIKSGAEPSDTSGLGILNKFIQDFGATSKDKKAIYDGINVEPENLLYIKQLLPNTLDKELKGFSTSIQLPVVPTNFSMLMSNIDYPTKSNENPNGSLYMKPTKEILDNPGADLGIKFFSNLKISEILHLKDSIKNESYYCNKNSMLMSLLEVEDESTGLDKTKNNISISGPLTNDLTNNVAGKELEQNTKKREQQDFAKGMESKLLNPILAIDNYVKSSLSVINDLIRTVCGNDNNLKDINQKIIQLNSAAEGDLAKWVKSKDPILHEIMSSAAEDRNRLYDKHNDVCIRVNEIANNIQTILKGDQKKYKAWCKLSQDAMSKITWDIKELDHQLYTVFNANYDTLKKQFKNNNDDSKEFDIKTDSNERLFLKYSKLLKLNEDEQFKKLDELNEQLKEKCDGIKKSTSTIIENEMAQVLASDPYNWRIIEETKTRMEALKKAADTEITEKIGLICRTSQSAQSTLGDKFKAALSKHPVRAESLKNIWARYSDDLDDRIKTRMRNITHSQGNSSIYVTIKEFLINTYPNLISSLLYYKQLFYLIDSITSKNPIEVNSIDKIKQHKRNEDLLALKIKLQNAYNDPEISNNLNFECMLYQYINRQNIIDKDAIQNFKNICELLSNQKENIYNKVKKLYEYLIVNDINPNSIEFQYNPVFIKVYNNLQNDVQNIQLPVDISYYGSLLSYVINTNSINVKLDNLYDITPVDKTIVDNLSQDIQDIKNNFSISNILKIFTNSNLKDLYDSSIGPKYEEIQMFDDFYKLFTNEKTQNIFKVNQLIDKYSDLSGSNTDEVLAINITKLDSSVNITNIEDTTLFEIPIKLSVLNVKGSTEILDEFKKSKMNIKKNNNNPISHDVNNVQEFLQLWDGTTPIDEKVYTSLSVAKDGNIEPFKSWNILLVKILSDLINNKVQNSEETKNIDEILNSKINLSFNGGTNYQQTLKTILVTLFDKNNESILKNAKFGDSINISDNIGLYDGIFHDLEILINENSICKIKNVDDKNIRESFIKRLQNIVQNNFTIESINDFSNDNTIWENNYNPKDVMLGIYNALSKVSEKNEYLIALFLTMIPANMIKFKY